MPEQKPCVEVAGRRSGAPSRLPSRALLVAAAIATALAAGRAEATLATYYWQPSVAGPTALTQGTAVEGIQVSYGAQYNSWACNTQSNIGQRRTIVMNNSAFLCTTGTSLTTSQSGPFEMLLAIDNTPYAVDTIVTGQKTGTLISMAKSVAALAVTVRVTLGYADAGYFYPWGYTEFPLTTAGLQTVDLSRVSGVAPAGSSLALQVALVQNSAGNTVTLYVNNTRATGDASGTVVVDETPKGAVTIADVATKEATDGTIVAPGAGPTLVDAFVVSTTNGATGVPIYRLTFAFDTGTAEALSLVEVTNQAGTVVYGSIANPATDTFDVALTNPIFASGTATEYRARVTMKPRTGANPLPRRQAWTVRGMVYGALAAVPVTITDTDAARVTLDDLPPAPPKALAAQASQGQVSLSWTNPFDAALDKIVVLRGTSASFTTLPADGATYAVGNAIGNGTVACVVTQPASSCTDAIASGSLYYEAFTVDAYGNYSAPSTVVGPAAPGATTVVAAGAPAATAATVCPGGAQTFAGSFSLQATSGAADTVTGLTVRLSAGSTYRVSAVTLTDSLNAPIAVGVQPASGEDWTFSGLSLAVPVSPSAASQYRIQITPSAPFVGMSPANQGVSASVVGATHLLATNLVVSDAPDAVITVDSMGPADPTGFTGTSPGSGQMTLSWTNPTADFASYVVVARSTSQIVGQPARGTSSYAVGAALVPGVTVVCAGNLTTCADSGLVNGTTYYYKVFARDACANWSAGASFYGGPSATLPALALTAGTLPTGAILRGGAPAAVARFVLTASGADAVLTSVAVKNVAATSPAQPDVDVASVVISEEGTGSVIGLAQWDATSGTYTLGSLARTIPVGSPLTLRVTVSATRAATLNANFQAQLAAAGVGVQVPASVSGATVTANVFPIQAAAVAEGSTAGYSLLPQVAIANPSDGKVLSGTFRLQVTIWSPTANGTQDLTSYTYTTDGSSPVCTGTAKTLTKSGNYQLGNRSAVYETQVTLPQGAYVLQACAATAAGVVQSRAVNVVVKAAGAGDGNLLVRDNSEQLCTDCHNLRTHSSQTTSRKYGSWSVGCRDCHTPHGAKNTYLVKNQITPPAVNGVQAPRTVNFKKTTGDSGVAAAWNAANTSFINADGTGPCQTCHTRTSNPADTNVARWRNTGNKDSHYTQGAGTRTCIDCHKHKNGFSPESRGGDSCDQCHTKIWTRMNGTVAVGSRHPIGNVPSVNAAPTDSGIAWNGGTDLQSAQPASARSCMNMCHPDKRHNEPGGWSHAYGVYGDATNGTTRAVTRGQDGEIVTGNVSDTDFDANQATGGLCTSCHQKPVAPGGYTITKASFGGTAHDFDSDPSWGTWGYTQRDQSRYRRNCTKCHSDRADKQPTDETYPFGAVHYSDYPRLLAGTLKPGLDGQGVFLCYNCHGNGVIGVNRSNDIVSSSSKFFAHPVNTDQYHLLGDAEYNAATWGNQAGNPSNPRHASCLDCHASHVAKRGGHSYIGGTVTIAANSTAVTGIGTRWTPFYVGARIKFGSNLLDTTGTATWYTVATVNSPTSITLTTAGPATAQTGVLYRIEQMTNKAGPAVDGAWGIVPNWTNIAAGAQSASDADVTKKKLTYNSDLEAYLCMKCHSKYWWGNAIPPVSASGFSYYVGTATFTNNSTAVTGQGTTWYTTTNPNRYVGALIKNAADGKFYKIASVTSATALTLATAYTGTTATAQPYAIQMTHTDQMQEFNPKNRGYHPVFQSRTTQTGYGAPNTIGDPGTAGKYWPVTENILSPWTMTSVMTCSDCHEADSPNDAGGPHGSSYKFMLKGPNRIWDENTRNSSGGMPPGTFCGNCHDATFPTSGVRKSRFPEHRIGDHAGGIMCFDCHLAIPHGSSSVGMLNNGNGTGFTDKVYPYDQSVSNRRLYIRQIPTNGYFDNQNYCGCSSPTSH